MIWFLGRRFRNAKRFMAIPTPFTCVNWWRMVMDEAQMLESTTSKTAEMALRLSSIHRWCVTGKKICTYVGPTFINFLDFFSKNFFRH